jgi:hypothetical protein
MRTCTKCGTEKELSEFNKDKTRKEGLFPHCKVCKRDADNAYRSANAERLRAERRARYAANPEPYLERSRKTNRKCDAYRQAARKRYAANPLPKLIQTRKRTKEDVSTVSDRYVRRMKAATGIDETQITAYRETLLIKREYQAFKKFLTEIENVIEKTD